MGARASDGATAARSDTGSVASSEVDAIRETKKRSALHTIEGVNSMLKAAHNRIDAGEYTLVELAALAEVKVTVEAVIDAAVRWLGSNDEASYRELGIALGVTRSAVEKRWPGISGREEGGQPSRLR
jgi:hypothetical protein